MTTQEMVHAIQKKTMWPMTRIAKEIGINHVTLRRMRRDQMLKPITVCKLEKYYERMFNGK